RVSLPRYQKSCAHGASLHFSAIEILPLDPVTFPGGPLRASGALLVANSKREVDVGFNWIRATG
ncbi:MAG: hypothetical protein WBF47_03480, partial [Xanthobacteraceae bacterium]